jgi:major membrane immunogen (membrane-anchored lipoprotein)
MQAAKKQWLVLTGFLIVLFASCSAGGSVMQDGYYTAEAAEFDVHGWKEYITICVSGGQIIVVEYNAYNASGFIKSWDMDYMRLMNAIDGTYPNAYTRYYSRQLLIRQGTEGIDRITGATASYNTFINLAKAVLENARQGDRKTRLVHFKKNGQDAH